MPSVHASRPSVPHAPVGAPPGLAGSADPATPGAARAVATRTVDGFDGLSRAERNRQTVDAFYTAFAAKDGAAMTAAYAPDARFSDEVFPDLRGAEPGAMWRMLCESDDLRIRHEIVSATDDTVVAKWVANYSFNGNPIENHVTATLKLQDGKIVEHKDEFDMSRWLGQAYGMATWLPFGETVLAHVTRRVADSRLRKFIASGG